MPGRGRRIVSFLLCLCMIAPFLSDFSGWVLSSVAEATGYATERKADPNTMDDYLKQLLSTDWGSRYAGRIWTDKSVLAFGQEGITNWSKMNDQWQLALDMATDGFEGIVGSKADFLHIFSALASSQRINEYPPSPIDLVILIDMSGSMAADVVDSTHTHTDYLDQNGDRVTHSRIYAVLETINKTIQDVMDISEDSRVAVVAYGATAYTLMELGHYKAPTDGKYLNVSNFRSYFYISSGQEKKPNDSGSATYLVGTADGLQKLDDNGTTYSDYKRYARNDYRNVCFSCDPPETRNIGFHTDLQAGIYQGFEELYKHYTGKDDVTATYVSENTGTKTVVQRIPVAIVMTDGGSNYALKSATGSVTGDEWYNVPIYEKNMTEYRGSWAKYCSEADSAEGGDAAILDILMTASYEKSKVQKKYGQLVQEARNDEDNPLLDERYKGTDFRVLTVSVDTPDTEWQKPRVYAALDPVHFFNSNPKTYNGIDPSTWTKRQDVIDAYHLFEQWQAASDSITKSFKGSYNYLSSSTVTFNQLPTENEVTKDDVIKNINYNNSFSDIESAALTTTFDNMLDEIRGIAFTPLSGSNDAGVGDSITYQDPLGTYMEIKNQAITAQTHKDESAGTYDMSLLVFGQMHGLVRAGVYDWNWNNKWMELNDSEGMGTKAFEMGWYKGEPKKGQKALVGTALKSNDSGTWPADYDSAEEAWEDGWVFRFNFETLLQFVPITGVDTSDTTVHPSNLPDQVKNTVYTCYRFAGTQEERNALHRNPVFGDVPTELKEAWEEAKKENENNQYPDSNKLYADTPGVYRLSDIRVWVEDYGDYTDTTGAITPNQGYDRSLYLNVPAAAVPTQLATVTLGPDGVLSYETNLGDDHEAGTYYGKDEGGKPIKVTEAMQNAFYAQSTPLRLFYAVGLEEDLILRDEETDEQIGVDFTKISPEYILAHTVEDKNYVWFLSNFYSNTTYDEYVTDTVTSPTRGDPTVTFSPNADNRYYVFQKPLPLYAHAYRNTADGLKAVDNERNDGKYWREWASGKVGEGNWEWLEEYPNGAGNGHTKWENGTNAGSWGGGEYMGTYKDGSTFETKKEEALAKGPDEKGNYYITDDHGNTYLYVENGIIFLEADVLDHVTSKPDGGYAEGSISFNSDDYYFMLVEYYLPDKTTGKDQMGVEIPGTHGGRMVQRVVARRGSEFGSGFASDQIDNGDMLCWTDMSGKITLELEYLSKSDTGDLTRGEPTFEKLTYTAEKLPEYFEKTCGIDPAKTMANPDYDSEKGEDTSTNPKEVNVIEHLVQYWQDVQKDSKVQAALAEAREEAGSDGLTAGNFNNYFQFAVSARKGGIRSGDMANNRHAKTMQDKEGNTVSGNVTNTAENYYVPTVSDNSATDNGVILNTYLGNNGYLEVANQMLHVTKLLEAPDGYTLSQAAYDEEFNFQVYVQGVSGKRSAILTEYNEFSKSWDRQLAYIDVLTDNSDLVVDNDSNRALFVKSTVEGTQGKTLTAKQVIAQTDEDGNPVYYEANEDGTLPTKDDGSLDESKIVKITTENPLYYLYLPSNGDSETAKHTRRLYQNGRYDGAADGYASTNFIKNGTTTFYAEGQGEDTGVEPGVGNNDSYRQTNDEVKRPAGTITYWAQDAELIPVSEVQAAETVDSILSGEPSAYASEAVDSTPGVWTHNADNHSDHVALTFFTFVIRRPSGETSMTAFESPFKTRSSYMTVDLVFGQNANADGSGESGTGLSESNLYDTIIPSADRSDLFGNVKKSDGTEGPIDNDYIAAHTAEFTLKHGEGLLLSGLDNRIPYRFTEKLTPDQLAKGYTLKQINHIQQRDSDTVYMPGVQEIPVYVDGSGNVTWEQDGATKNMEPFAHTNAVLWESYATMTNTGNHHDPENNPSCKETWANGGCDLPQGDGSTRHYFYYGGKLVDPHYEKEDSTSRYVLNPTAHFGTVGETQESTATLPADGYYKYNGVYSVYGNTGYFEEQANYVNTVSPDMLALTKELVDGEGNPVKTTADIPFKFTLDLTPDSNAVMTNNDEKLYYWVGSTEDLAKFPEAGGPPLLSEYQSYIKEDGTSDKLKVLTPDEGNPNQYTVTFNAGQAVVIYGLINGTGYTVTEEKKANYPAYQDYYSYSGKIVHLQPVDPEPGVTPYAEMIPNRTVNREGFKNRIITGSLTVEKRIDETEPDGNMEFTFTLTLTEKADAADVEKLDQTKLTVTKYKSNGELYDSSEYSSTWVDSTEGTLTLTFTLKHKEKITVDGIPMDTAFEVKETDRRGYDLKSVVHVNANRSDGAEYEVANDAVNDTVTATQNPDVRFINVQPPLLPFTGGIGVGVFYLLGFALLLASGAFYVGICKKRRAGEK